MIVSVHIQKDKRINLGTAGHKTVNCPTLRKNRIGRKKDLVDVGGRINFMIPKCKVCFR